MNNLTQKPLQPPLAVVDGIRTPFAKAFTGLADIPAAELGRTVVAGLLSHSGLQATDIGEVVFGNVAAPADAANIGRVISLTSGIPDDRPAHTVNRNCASGMESVISAWQLIKDGRTEIAIAGGTESMSSVPLLWKPQMQQWLIKLRRATMLQKAGLLAQLRPSWFQPVVALELGLTDPTCGENMIQTAERLAREFAISRTRQDEFALLSHQRATAAWERGFFKNEVTSVATKQGKAVSRDSGPRDRQTLEALSRLRPLLKSPEASITAGNSCPITDGAAALLLMTPDRAKSQGLKPLGFIRAYAVAGCDPTRMGLGPVFATHRLLTETGMKLSDFDLFEINEAFAAQVLACLDAFQSTNFAKTQLHRDTAIGTIDPAKLNINGGAIALGHPVGTSGTRLILTLLRALRERGLQRGIASLCVGGGQGIAIWVENNLEDSS